MVRLRIKDVGPMAHDPDFRPIRGPKSVAPPKLESRRDWNRDAIVANFNRDP